MTTLTIGAQLEELAGKEISEDELNARFIWGACVGKGGTAKVYKARQRNNNNQVVAIKVFDKACLINQRASMKRRDVNNRTVNPADTAVKRAQRRLRAIINEISIYKSLDHKNIAKFYECVQSTHKICIIQEWINGRDLLEEVMNHGSVNESSGCAATTIIYQLLQAVSHLHNQKVIHRDIKLENVLWDGSRVVLVDFGMSLKYERTDDAELSSVCGTPLYCSPESLSTIQNNNNSFNGLSSDVWSIGVLIYALVTGCALFNDQSLRTLLDGMHEKVRQTGRVEFCDTADIISSSLQSLLRDILVWNPSERASVNELLVHEYFSKPEFSSSSSSCYATESSSCDED